MQNRITPDEITEVLLAIAGERRPIYAGYLNLLDAYCCSEHNHGLVVLLNDKKPEPSRAFVLSISHHQDLRKVTAVEACRLAKIWLNLRHRFEVSCPADWSRSLPRFFPGRAPRRSPRMFERKRRA